MRSIWNFIYSGRTRLEEYLRSNERFLKRVGPYLFYSGVVVGLVCLVFSFLANEIVYLAWASASGLVAALGEGLRSYGTAEPTSFRASLREHLIVRDKLLQAILLVTFGLITWIWVIQIAIGKTGGTGDEAAALFFIGFGALIFGSYRGRQVILASAEVGGVGKHITKRNFGVVLILAALVCWFFAWRGFEMLQQFPPRPPGTLAVGAEKAAQGQMILGAIVGFLLLISGYGLVNPTKSQYAQDIERHGYPRTVPTSVKLEVWRRDGGRCVICGSTEDLHFDHVIPYSKGGSSTDPRNIQVLCSRCNLEKHAKIE